MLIHSKICSAAEMIIVDLPRRIRELSLSVMGEKLDPIWTPSYKYCNFGFEASSLLSIVWDIHMVRRNELLLKKKTQILEYQAFPEAIIKIFRNN